MILWITGVLSFLAGWTHRWIPVRRIESRAALNLQDALGKTPWLGVFQDLWFFGRTSFALIALGLLAAADWRKGLPGLLVFGLAAGVERLVKLTVGRERPYQEEEHIHMHQLKTPTDPSFPSGDCLRVWYLVPLLIIALGLSLPGQALLISLAVLVSAGRVVLGVHYPTDVLSGSGLGLLGAAFTLWIWHIMF